MSVDNGTRTKHFELIDVLSIQSLSRWNGATYLATSNFNCHEFTNPRQTAAGWVTSYYADPTQVPYTALVCGLSIVYRNCFIQYDCIIGQISKEIEHLKAISVTNGYCNHRPKKRHTKRTCKNQVHIKRSEDLSEKVEWISIG